MDKIVIATSISPKNIKEQKINIDSWIANGFSVISCNPLQEIAEIKQHFSEVEFVEMPRDARAECGKSVPYIYDILQTLRNTGAKTCGIVNSDIYFYNMPENICDFIKEEAKESLLFIRRSEVEEFEDIFKMNFQYQLGGADTFFFDNCVMETLPDDGFAIGQGGWDHWMPIVSNINKITVKEISNPITFHVLHDVQWGDTFCRLKVADMMEKYHITGKSKTDKAVEISMDQHRAVTNRLECKRYCTQREVYSNSIVIINDDNIIGEDIKEELNKFKSFNIYTKEDFIKEKASINADIFIKLPKNASLYSYSIKAIIQIMTLYNKNTIFTGRYFIQYDNGVVKYHYENYNFESWKKINSELCEYLVAAKDSNDLYKELKEESFLRMPLCYKIVNENFIYEHKLEKIKGKVAIIPAGFQAEQWIEKFADNSNDYTVIAILDNNCEKWGEKIQDLTIQSPEFLKGNNEIDQLLIVSLFYNDEIKKQAMEYLPENKIITWF